MSWLKNRYKKDWIGLWYEIAQSRGINNLATIGHVDPSGEVNYHQFCHSKGDGIGQFSLILKDQGVALQDYPKARPEKHPTFFQIVSLLIKGAKNLEVVRPKWKFFREVSDYKNQDPAIIKFTTEETNRLHCYLSKMGFSENAYLLQKSCEILYPKLLEQGGQEGDWVFPVNMRGNVEKDNPHMNLSSGFYLRVSGKDTPETIKNKIKKNLSDKVHWSNWFAYHIGVVIGVTGMKYLSKRAASKSGYLGTFTNMGHWSEDSFSDNISKLKRYSYFCAPPGTHNYPVGIGVLTWMGKLTMTLKIHPTVIENPTERFEISQSIKKSILDFDSELT